MFAKMKERLASRSFFSKLLTSMLVFVCIPMTLMLYLFVSNAYSNMYEMHINNAQSDVNEANIQLADQISELKDLSIRLPLDTFLRYHELSKDVLSEQKAIEILNYYGLAIPFVDEFGLYFKDHGLYYSSGGKYEIGLYENHIIKNPGAVTQVKNLRDPLVLTDEDGMEAGTALLLYPSSYVSMDLQKTIAIYQLSADSLRNILRQSLPDGFEVVSFCMPNGKVLYLDEALLDESQTDAYMQFTATSLSGYELITATPRDSFLKEVTVFRNTMYLLVLVSLVSSLILIVLMAYTNSLPLKKLVTLVQSNQHGEDQKRTSEFDMIGSMIEDTREQYSQMADKMEEQKELLITGQLDKLLDGGTIPAQELSLSIGHGIFTIAVTSYSLNTKIGDLKARLSALHTETEMLYILDRSFDNYIVFFCQIDDAEDDTAMARVSDIQKALGYGTVPFAYSPPFEKIQDLYQNYLETVCALEQNKEKSSLIFSRSLKLGKGSADENLIKLVQSVKDGNEQSSRMYLDELFSEVDPHTDSMLIVMYQYQKLLREYYTKIHALSATLCLEPWESVSLKSAEFKSRAEYTQLMQSMVLEHCRQMREVRKDFEKQQFDEILAFIHANYTDPDLCRDQICTHFNVTPYSLNTLFKENLDGNFRKYVIDLRMQLAKEKLLSTDISVSDIAVQTGFMSTSYFIRTFKSYFGVTPSKYREEQLRNDGL